MVGMIASKRVTRAPAPWLAVLGCVLLMASPGYAQQRGAPRVQTPEQRAQMLQQHLGLAGALDPANLAKPRPKPPFDMTGTWFIDLSGGFSKFMFGPPYPEFFEEGKKALAEGKAARAAGHNYRDSIGQCYPAGMPMIMTRVWPITFVQLPTVVVISLALITTVDGFGGGGSAPAVTRTLSKEAVVQTPSRAPATLVPINT